MIDKIKNLLFLVLLASCGSDSSPEKNTAPELIALLDYAIDENTTEVTTFQAYDAEGDVITYSISGTDVNLLSIGSSSGILSFIDPPDYENPQDNDLDNIYVLTVTASDGEFAVSLGIIVTINDVVEGSGGLNMLLMGNSFFRPYAERFRELALDAEFLEHIGTTVFRGGDNGTPIGLWNNTDTQTEI